MKGLGYHSKQFELLLWAYKDFTQGVDLSYRK